MAQANIPKVMNITPQILGVDKFIKDAGKITTSVNRMTTGINKAITRLNKKPVSTANLATGLTQTTTAANKSIAALQGTSAAMTTLAAKSAAANKAVALAPLTKAVAGYTAIGKAVGKVGTALSSGLTSLNKWASGLNFSNNIATKFGGNLVSLGSTITRFSFQVERLGRGMLMAFTLPIIAIGYASVKAFADFETGMTKVATLVTDNTVALAVWEEHILSTAASLSSLPTDMAEGLFAVASGFGSEAGNRIETVINVLDASTKAAKLGLGEVEDVGRTATAMMNAFGESNLSAETAVSLLVLAVREGNLAVDELAGALGNVLGTTAAIGASADDALAFVAAYTRFGVAPARAVTALNTTLTSLIKPTTAARDILESYGLTLGEIKERIGGPGGLAQLLVDMRQTMSETDFYALFPRRALRGALAVTGTEMNEFYDTYLQIASDMQKEADNTVDGMTNSYERGSDEWKLTQQEIREEGLITPSVLSKAWDIFGDTLAAKFGVIKGQIQSIFIGVGSAFEPILKDVADRIIEFLIRVETFIRENQESVRLLTYMALGLAALAPGIIIGAKLAQAFGVFASGLGYVVGGIGRVVGGMLNLIFHGARLAIVIGVTVVKSFVLFIAGIAKAIFGIGVLIGKMIALMAFQLGQWALTLSLSFVTLGASALTAAAGIGLNLVAGLLSVTAAAVPAIAAIGGIVGALVLVGGGVLAAVGAFQALGSKITESISDVKNNVATMTGGIKQELSDLAGEGKTWGEGLMRAYNDGLIEGMIYVIDTLITLANWITRMFSTHSPPRILPDIDKWGQQTMQVWIDGWGKADFGVFNTISGIVKGFLGSILSDEDEGKEGNIISKVLGTRQYIAAAINQVKKFGEASKQALQDIYNAVGITTLEFENYIEAVLVAAGTTDRLAQAQQKVNDINEKYSALLAPIQKQLDDIDRKRSAIADTEEANYLRRIKENESLPDRVKQLAGIRLDEIKLEIEQGELEKERDDELFYAEERVRLATIANDAALEQLEIAKETLALQTQGLDMQAQLLAATESLKESMAAVAKGVGDLASGLSELGSYAPAGIDLPELDTLGEDGGTIGNVKKTIEDLVAKLEELKVASKGTWTAMTEDIALWWGGVKAKYFEWARQVNEKWGPTFKTIKREGARTWTNLTTVIKNFWTNSAGDRDNITTWFGEFRNYLADNLPTAIGIFSDFINEDLIGGALVPLAEWMTGDDKWGKGKSTGPQEDWENLNTWFKNFEWATPEGDPFFDVWGDGAGQEPTDWQQIMQDFMFPGGVPGIAEGQIGGAVDFTELIPTEKDWENLGISIQSGWDGMWTGLDFGRGRVQEGLHEIIDVVGEPLRDLKQLFIDTGQAISDFFSGETDDTEVKIMAGSIGSLGLSVDGAALSTQSLGEGFDEAMRKGKLFMAHLLILKNTALTWLGTKVDDVKDGFTEFWEEVIETKDNLIELGSEISGSFMTALSGLGTYLADIFNDVFAIFKVLVFDVKEILVNSFNQAMKDLAGFFEDLYETIVPILEPLQELWTKIKGIMDALSGASDWVVAWFKGGGSGDDITDKEAGGGDSTDTQSASPAPTSAFGTIAGSVIGGYSGVIADSFAPAGRTIDALTMGLTSGNAMVASMSGSMMAPPTMMAPGAAYAAPGGVALSFGDVTINTDMDMAVFEARVRNVVVESMNS